MRISQKDIARALGISLITVNRAFNDSGYVSRELKSRIFEYAKRNAYIPHRASQILVRNKTRHIGLFTAIHPDYFWNDIWQGVMNAGEYIRPLNYEVHYHRIPDYDTDCFLKVIRRQIRKGLDAAIIPCVWIFNMQEITGLLDREGIPYLFCNVDNPGLNRICYIGPDYPAGGRLAAGFIGKALSLKNTGTVLIIGAIERDERRLDAQNINSRRIEGFFAAMGELYPGVSCKTEYCRVVSQRSIDAQILGILKKHQGQVDAVYLVPAYNSVFLAALERYDYRRTITVVHDVNEQAISSLDSGLLTAVVYQDPVLQGYRAVRTLETSLESKYRERLRDIEIAHTLVFRENVNFLRNHYWMPEAAE